MKIAQKLITLFIFALLITCINSKSFAQEDSKEKTPGSPGSIVFCGGQKQEDCYFKIGEEKTARLSREFDSSSQNIYMRAYFGVPLGTNTLSISLYKDGEFFKGRKESDFDPNFKATFINLTNYVWWNNKPFPRGNYCVKVSKPQQEGAASVDVVLAKGCFIIR
jgi:hypothetical protein